MMRVLIVVVMLCVLVPAIPSYSAGKQTVLNADAPKKSAYPKIVIYTVSWCPHCRELKEYLTSNNIPFINNDVELEPSAMEMLTTRYKTYGVPVIVIGNDQKILKGFTPDEFEKAVQKISAKKP